MSGASDARERLVRSRVNEVVDPCSTAMAEPIGIDDMGIVQRVRIDGGAVEVTLLPTSPHCLFLGLFEEEIEERLQALPWVESVRVALTDELDVWDEERIAPAARERLRRRRQATRDGLAAARARVAS